jgi:hypothetical protein
MYLTDVTEGGETVFPHVAKADHQTLENGWSNCSLQVSVGPDRIANWERAAAVSSGAAPAQMHRH